MSNNIVALFTYAKENVRPYLIFLDNIDIITTSANNTALVNVYLWANHSLSAELDKVSVNDIYVISTLRNITNIDPGFYQRLKHITI